MGNCDQCLSVINIPVGPIGVTGATGATGPAGANGINGINGVSVLYNNMSAVPYSATSGVYQALMTYAMPGGTMANNGDKIKINTILEVTMPGKIQYSAFVLDIKIDGEQIAVINMGDITPVSHRCISLQAVVNRVGATTERSSVIEMWRNFATTPITYISNYPWNALTKTLANPLNISIGVISTYSVIPTISCGQLTVELYRIIP